MLDWIAFLLLLVLVIGFFFARDKNSEKAQQLQQSITQIKASPNKMNSQIPSVPTHKRIQMGYPKEQMMMLNDQPVIIMRQDSGNPFIFEDNGLDIISRV